MEGSQGGGGNGGYINQGVGYQQFQAQHGVAAEGGGNPFGMQGMQDALPTGRQYSPQYHPGEPELHYGTQGGQGYDDYQQTPDPSSYHQAHSNPSGYHAASDPMGFHQAHPDPLGHHPDLPNEPYVYMEDQGNPYQYQYQQNDIPYEPRNPTTTGATSHPPSTTYSPEYTSYHHPTSNPGFTNPPQNPGWTRQPSQFPQNQPFPRHPQQYSRIPIAVNRVYNPPQHHLTTYRGVYPAPPRPGGVYHPPRHQHPYNSQPRWTYGNGNYYHEVPLAFDDTNEIYETWDPVEFAKPRRKKKVVHYVMEDVDDVESEEEVRPSRKKSKKSDKEKKSPKKRKSSKDKEKTKEKKSSKKSDKKKPKEPPRQKKIAVVKSPRDLSSFGTFAPLHYKDPKYKAISNYAKNSSGIKESRGEVKIHQIVEFAADPNSKPGAITFRGAPQTKPTRMLLWWKTTPGSVKHLAVAKDGFIAFYDRMARALAVSPEDLVNPLRQTLVLCSVSLGKIYKSPHGYRYWSSKSFPDGNDSIKAVGRYAPNWKRNFTDENTAIPCGETVEQGKFKKYEVDYSEYMIYECRRAKVRYAVDIEIIPKKAESSSEESESDSETESDSD